jgi:uncharacterized membrane protein YbhN (UPF0104 family)
MRIRITGIMSLTTKKLLLFAAGAACLGLACLFFYSSLVTIPETSAWWNTESLQTTGTVVEVRRDYRNVCTSITR